MHSHTDTVHTHTHTHSHTSAHTQTRIGIGTDTRALPLTRLCYGHVKIYHVGSPIASIHLLGLPNFRLYTYHFVDCAVVSDARSVSKSSMWNATDAAWLWFLFTHYISVLGMGNGFIFCVCNFEDFIIIIINQPAAFDQFFFLNAFNVLFHASLRGHRCNHWFQWWTISRQLRVWRTVIVQTNTKHYRSHMRWIMERWWLSSRNTRPWHRKEVHMISK